ncbi:hypothetical protein [Rhizobium aouanii]|uniref:Uncharacterized protein n=1 Tax=Rhizobium aouanii TaxID=3118145 RepID=A0ABU8CSW4_9HYPH
MNIQTPHAPLLVLSPISAPCHQVDAISPFILDGLVTVSLPWYALLSEHDTFQACSPFSVSSISAIPWHNWKQLADPAAAGLLSKDIDFIQDASLGFARVSNGVD